MEIGKFPTSLLEKMLAKNSIADPRVLLGPIVGEDAAVLDMGERLLVAASDPVTFATDLAGWYSVQVNANDVACSGAQPRWFLGDPVGTGKFFQKVKPKWCSTRFWRPVQRWERPWSAAIAKSTYGIDRPIILGTMLGEVDRDSLIRTGGGPKRAIALC